MKMYSCGICKTTPDQISHHKSHLETQKHKDKREIFLLKLSKYNDEELIKLYDTSDINDILSATETIIHKEDSQLNENLILCNENTHSIKTLEEIMNDQRYSLNSEELRDKIHEIHNFLRNSGSGYGMNAMKVFMIFYGLKRVEELGGLTFDEHAIKEIEEENLNINASKFSYLSELASNPSEYENIVHLVYNDMLSLIAKCELRHILFHEIPRAIMQTGRVFATLIKYVNEIFEIEKRTNLQVVGKIYEYFIGRDKSAISELGAYFTNRDIVDCILEKVKPTLDESGNVPSMIDMFGGSGGFTTGFIDHLNKKHIIEKCKNDNITLSDFWKTQLQNIYHYDINEDVIRIAAFEFYCLTGGVVPDTKKNLSYVNAFTNNNERKYKYILTNPPYGGDKDTKSKYQINEEKVIKYIEHEIKQKKLSGEILESRKTQLKKIQASLKQHTFNKQQLMVTLNTCSMRIRNFAKKHKLTGNDKEACSLILLMDMLDIGGTCAGVLKEGVFFNKTYSDIRRCLISNFNVREIISIPQNLFENTQTKTSVVIFDNDPEKKTGNVIFSELCIETFAEDRFEEKDGEIYIVECKDDVKHVYSREINVVSSAEILSNPICSLNPKDYNKKEIVCGEGFELVKLGDICEFQNGFAFKSNEYKKKGIPLVSITHIKNGNIIFGKDTKYINENVSYSKFEIKMNDVVITLTGKKPTMCSVALYNDKTKVYLNQRCAILRNFKKITNKYFISIFNACILDYINKYLGNGTNQHNISLNDILNLQIPIPKSPEKIQEWVDKISAPYNEKLEKEQKVKELEEFVQNRIRQISDEEDCEEVELGSVLRFNGKKNKYKASDGNSTGIYRFYTSSQDKILYRNDFEFDNKYILLGRGGVPSIHLTSKFSVSHDDVYVMNTFDNSSNIDYIYYYIKMNMLLINETFKGSTIKHSSKTELSKIKLHIPRNKQLIHDLEPTFQQIETLQQEVKTAEKQYKEYIDELGRTAIIQSNTNNYSPASTPSTPREDDSNSVCSEPSSPENEIVEPPKKPKRTTKKTPPTEEKNETVRKVIKRKPKTTT
jgi:type I restriction enzyme, S subunit